jgi:hypothetical protein
VPVTWQIERQHRAWTPEEFRARYEFLPEKFEVFDGKLLLGINDRINLLALLLENVGLDAAVRLGRLETWQQALADAGRLPRETESRTPSWQLDDDLPEDWDIS